MESKIQGGKVEFSTAHEGKVTSEDAPDVQSWHCRDADQAERMLPTFAARAGAKMGAGEVSAIRDAANEFRKQRDS